MDFLRFDWWGLDRPDLWAVIPRLAPPAGADETDAPVSADPVPGDEDAGEAADGEE